MNSPMHLSFQLKKGKKTVDGKAPIFARITVNGTRSEFSIKRTGELSKWIPNTGYQKGNNEETKSLNAYLNIIRVKLNDHYNQLLQDNKPVSAEIVKNMYLGITEKGKTISEAFKYHNDQMQQLIGKDYALGTYGRYCTAFSHIQEFLKFKFKVSDLEVKHINYQFITEYEYYLKTVKKCGHNTAIKYITNFKKIVRLCIGNGWLEKNPFINYKIRLREVERDCLSKEELEIIANKKFASERMEQVRDIFLFCCFTGLAYADVKKLSKNHIVIGIDGERWIKINRTKTDTKSSIPVLPIPQAILVKYSTNLHCIQHDKLLPVISNQKLNGYLKEIADICGINKNITCHLARHTFATTITLTNGVPLESVSKMLGHRSIKTTQHYARIVDSRISEDMKLLKQKFESSEELSRKKIL